MVVISIASGLRVGIGIGACTVQRIIWTVSGIYSSPNRNLRIVTEVARSSAA
jgi:hypothetical protein